MHLSVRHSQTLEEGDIPVNPEQSPAELLMLSFTDSDLACMAEAYRAAKNPPSLRLTSLAPLKHPLSVDLYLEQVAAHAKIILVRLLGGVEWWRYGAEELARLAREKNIILILVPGCAHDPRLAELSTAPTEMVAAIDSCLAQGGRDNALNVLTCLTALARGEAAPPPIAISMAAGALYVPHSQNIASSQLPTGNVLILFYRAHMLAADTAPIDALCAALHNMGLAARAFMVISLKDSASLSALQHEIQQYSPDIMIDATAFSAGNGAHPLADLGVPILQIALANTSHDAWAESARGLGATDMAMHVVLPEADGRIFTRAISFKEETEIHTDTEFKHVIHAPQQSRIDYIAELASAWVRLAKKPAADRHIGLILSDYPDRAGRSAYAVGLDGPQSAQEILRLLGENGYHVTSTAAPEASPTERYSLHDYQQQFSRLSAQNQASLLKAWGNPEEDAFFADGFFHLPCTRHGHVIMALQPDRGAMGDRKSGYHDATTPPRHGYLAFYWWLRDVAGIDAIIHLGTHGNLEWLPGKSVALSQDCWPEITLGAMPVIYPYIVSDPGEAAQAKRRISAVTLSHLTPPLMQAVLSPELSALETLVDEYSSADGLDARRMKLLRTEIIHRARRSGLPGDNDNALMNSLEAHLCDIKEQRVGNGLHIFGHAPECESLATMADTLHEIAGGAVDKDAIAARLVEAAKNEQQNLLAALDGRFIMPGPGGSPVRGRLDILPTGRNMVTLDPRMIPTPTAAIIGKRAAEEFVRRYMQDHGDWPHNVVIDVWGSATLRNGGDEIAQALWLMGASPIWDDASGRVNGFQIIPDPELPWPRIDVSLRISGLFRDMFPTLITLFDDASQAVAKQENWPVIWRIFGSAPGAYGAGVTALLDRGNWTTQDELGQAYLDASHFAYGRHSDGQVDTAALKARIVQADAFIHVQDQREMDVLSGADFADNEGGFAAAASLLGTNPSLYHLDSSRPDHLKIRSLAEEISLTLQARALGPTWMAGQMRHGYAGAAAFADIVDQLFAFAATTPCVTSAQFDAVFDAYVHDEEIRNFMMRENPAALAAIAQRFEEAIRRGLWNPLRNSAWILLRTIQGEKTAEEAA